MGMVWFGRKGVVVICRWKGMDRERDD